MLTTIAGWILSKFGVYILGAAILGGGYLYVAHLHGQNELLTRQLAGYKRAMQIIKDDLKQDEEDSHEKNRIEALTPEQLPAEFDKLRQRARKANGSDSSDAGD